MPRTKSSQRWIARHVKDEYVKRAQKEGFRSRAAYKLAEIDARDHLFRAGLTVVDLGAAPGGWSQYAVKRVGPGGRVLAVDILPMEPLQGVELIQGDFTEAAVLNLVLERLQGRGVDLVISDMAPNISGVAASDQARSVYLAELALEFAAKTLRPGATLLVKTFQGEGFDALRRQMRERFEKLATRKPKASRAESREIYLLARGFRGDRGCIESVAAS
ncbi:MAG: 23S rRNA methyltransferase [Candidatus Muproteobacteria bacterium RBG_16_65_34]|uniref:Ribosomal RNA large subunit methyltransferase E n=1 Tax=Candidatus Muproteobacteria bacterium RBG_16_65_34 TaxID=1817760 RepID=A0A1F6TKY1_9PROT|nr:MAG: 23S rRNA methyltransferase [Candidatus Muproteobacteria bacterium RBG_16_65_34]